jgi:trehalose 6-phosphate synthase/phosphatase
MKRLLLVSNRLPVTLEKRDAGYSYRESVGGVATGLSSFYREQGGLWVGWCGIPSEAAPAKARRQIEARLAKEFRCHSVFLSRNDLRQFYHGFCNKTIWPLFHHFVESTVYSESQWESYRRVNKQFCQGVLKVAKPGDTIWIHDYHLMLLPGMLRKALPESPIGFFLHIPFPSFEVFRLMPWRKEILKGMLGADLIGFHTYDYVRHFLRSARRIVGCEQMLGEVSVDNRVVMVDAFPMGIDYARFASAAEDPEIKAIIERIRKKVGERRLILSVDRLDYTKGIVQRLLAFDLFLEKNPEYREKVTLILVAVPSRTAVEAYMQLKRHVDELVGRINGKHGTIGWIPIWYLYRLLPFETLSAFYAVADVALITPLRDGMNLIAKEFVAAQNDQKGVLILSEMAGAAEELGEAIIVNPSNREEVAAALRAALAMPESEQVARNRVMQARLSRYNVFKWATDFMDRLSGVKAIQQQLYARSLVPKMETEVVRRYRRSSERLLLLDYDGTLVPFVRKPQKARPDDKILQLLRALTRDSKNEVVLISGRDKATLEGWFKGVSVGLVAEHGVWLKDIGTEWRTIEPMTSDWKKDIRPIFELYVDRTPGSFLEEKEFSLVWHYRSTNPDLASVRVRELKDVLLYLTANKNLGVLDGNRVVEVKSAGVNKGTAVLHWLRKRQWDFILAIGDDVTDESTFGVLPESAYSIKVGLEPSRAKFNVGCVEEVRTLLQKLEERKHEDA